LDTKKYGPVIFTSLGQFFFNETKSQWEKLSFIPAQLRYEQFEDAELFNEDQFIYGTGTSIIIFDYATGKIIFEEPLKGIVSLCRYSDDEVAIAFRNDGVKILNTHTRKFTKEFPLTRELNNKMEATILNEVRPASNGSLMVATDHNGLVIIDSLDTVTWLTHDPININSIGSNHARRVLYSEQGDIIVGSTIAGISSFDIYDRRAGYKTMFHDGKGNFYDSYIADITEDRNGVLWMGGWEKLISWDKENDKVDLYKFYTESEGFGYEIRSICIDSTGKIWVGSLNNGLSVFNERTGGFKQVPLDSTKGAALKDNNILELLTASDGIIWASTRFGVFTINPSTYSIDAFSNNPVLKELSGKRVDRFFQDHKQRIWMPTFADGVYCYDKINNKLTHYSKENGLPQGRCFAAYEDSKQNIYVGTSTGFSIISPDGKISSFNQSNGLRYEWCTGILEDENGQICL
jgi:ligand-binding sensor domain-containing protein